MRKILLAGICVLGFATSAVANGQSFHCIPNYGASPWTVDLEFIANDTVIWSFKGVYMGEYKEIQSSRVVSHIPNNSYGVNIGPSHYFFFDATNGRIRLVNMKDKGGAVYDCYAS
jgi:hypothetical protein